MFNAGADLPDRFMPDRVVKGCKVQIAIGCMDGYTEFCTGDYLLNLLKTCRVVQPVVAISDNFPACITGLFDTVHPRDIIPDLCRGREERFEAHGSLWISCKS